MKAVRMVVKLPHIMEKAFQILTELPHEITFHR
jgi:hypothetical protein